MSKLIQQHVLLQESIDAIVAAMDFEDLSRDVLTRIMISTISNYQNKISVGIQDSAEDLLANFKAQISQIIFEKAANWKIANKDPFLFPRGCRAAFSKGKSTVFVIEQEPQIRSLLFDTGIVEEFPSPYLTIKEKQRLALCLPFVIFVMRFNEQNLSDAYCFWKTSQLKRITDPLQKCLLPNIHTNGSICMGQSWAISSVARTITHSEMAQEAIGYYWNSCFNSDLSDNWWMKSSVDPRLKCAKTWCETTLDDPSFILNVNVPSAEKNLQIVIDTIMNADESPDESVIKHQVTESIDQCVEGLFSKIIQYFKKTKFEKHHPKDITDKVVEAFKKATAELNNLIFVIQNESNKLRNQIKDEQSKEIKSVGGLWTNYNLN